MVVDPHTATATAAAKLFAGPGGSKHPMVTLATAHPAKFPDAVERATGERPTLPDHLADLMTGKSARRRSPTTWLQSKHSSSRSLVETRSPG